MQALLRSAGATPAPRQVATGYDAFLLTPTTPLQPPLGLRLRVATKALHQEVERAGVMRHLLRGSLGLDGYCLLLRNLHAVYEALESALQSSAAEHPALQALVPPCLWRSAALRQDLEQLQGSHWQGAWPLAQATRAYVERVAALRHAQPGLLAAHAYVRYLGDLNGGQMLARLVAPLLPTPPGQGLAFYAFVGPMPVATLQAEFRLALEQQADTEAQAQALVDEACSAFVRHRELFVELDGMLQRPSDPTTATKVATKSATKSAQPPVAALQVPPDGR